MQPKELISVDEAKQIILNNSRRPAERSIALPAASGYVLASPAIAGTDVPAFAQSSMDGYAVRLEEAGSELIVQGVMPAGAQVQVQLNAGHAMRIFTGAPLPEGADTIIVQEKSVRTENKVSFVELPAQKGLFVRLAGADVRNKDVILPAGTTLTPVLLGLLAGSGISTVNVLGMPAVTVIATGAEFAKTGSPLEFGQVYESNSLFLTSAMAEAGITDMHHSQADDTLEAVKTALQTGLETSDVVILTGGVSVGDFDFVRQAADLSGVHCQFHKVKQKPGKPFYFGTFNHKLIFGLPGNPASVVSCFYEYLLPALLNLMGKVPAADYISAVLTEDFIKVKNLTQFLKGFTANGEVSVLGGQESFRLRSFAEANCLVRLEEEKPDYKKGDTVRIRMLPT